MHITEYLNRFETYLRAYGFASNTRTGYSRTMKKFCDYLEYGNGPIEVDQIRREHLIDFLANCSQNGEKNNTVAVRALTLIKFFRWLKEQREIIEDPSERIPIPKEQARVPRYVSPQQIDLLMNQPDVATPWGLRDRAILELLYSSGLRISEALELRDINLEEGFIYVRRGKGGKSRNVPLGATACQWLARYIEEGRRRLLRCSCSELVFLSRSGERLSRQAFGKAISEYVRSAGLPAWISSHSLRHAAATHMLQRSAALTYIQQFLGHERAESTQIYTLVRSQDLKAVHASCHPRA
jgi:integrase/recombinase XerD